MRQTCPYITGNSGTVCVLSAVAVVASLFCPQISDVRVQIRARTAYYRLWMSWPERCGNPAKRTVIRRPKSEPITGFFSRLGLGVSANLFFCCRVKKLVHSSCCCHQWSNFSVGQSGECKARTRMRSPVSVSLPCIWTNFFASSHRSVWESTAPHMTRVG